MVPLEQPVRMVPVDAKLFESVGYVETNRRLYIKFRNAPAMCFNDAPRFRYRGLLAAPRKDAYFNTYIKNSYIAKETALPAEF